MTMMGSSLVVVEESRNPAFPEGARLVIYAGWVERGVADSAKMSGMSPMTAVQSPMNMMETTKVGYPLAMAARDGHALVLVLGHV